MSDRASQVLAEGVPPGMPRSFRALADHCNVPRTTLQHRVRGRRSVEEKAQSQYYLYPWEAKAFVKFLVHQDALERSVQIKHVRSIAWSLTCQRPPSDRLSKPSSKNWPLTFYRRHDGLRASRNGALNWNRYDIYDKVVHWFEVIGKVLENPAILEQNIYNMDETGIMLSKLDSVKVLVGKDNKRGYRGAHVKRTTVTAVECVSADSRYLNPMIIWPASTHRANWVTKPTPGWHYAYSDTGYTDSFLSLQWLKLVFDPQTKELANQKPWVLICDGFGTHESLEILEFCLENNIILCRLPSHTSHNLQPLDVSIFGPLKTAYRSQVERLERECVGTIGKEHFVPMYSPARAQPFTSRNIRAGWSKAGLFPFNPGKALSDIPKPAAELTAPQTHEVHSCTQDRVPQTPLTPVSVEAVASLHNLITEDANMLDETSKQRIRRHVQKLTNATQLSFAERALLQEHNRFLAEINNEAKPRRAAKSDVLGTARVMSYEDLEKARAERAAKEAAKEAKKAEREAKKAAKEVKKAASATPAAEEATTGKGQRGRKRKNLGEADAPEPKAKVARMSGTQVGEDETTPISWRAPVARMY